MLSLNAYIESVRLTSINVMKLSERHCTTSQQLNFALSKSETKTVALLMGKSCKTNMIDDILEQGSNCNYLGCDMYRKGQDTELKLKLY